MQDHEGDSRGDQDYQEARKAEPKAQLFIGRGGRQRLIGWLRFVA